MPAMFAILFLLGRVWSVASSSAAAWLGGLAAALPGCAMAAVEFFKVVCTVPLAAFLFASSIAAPAGYMVHRGLDASEIRQAANRVALRQIDKAVAIERARAIISANARADLAIAEATRRANERADRAIAIARAEFAAKATAAGKKAR